MVLDTVQESLQVGSGFYPGLDTLMVGSSLEQTINWRFQTNQELRHKQQVLSNLLKITKEYALPDRIAYETMRRLLKKKKGMYSFKWQIRELLDVLMSNDETKLRYVYKYRAIKDKYETVTGI